MARAQQATLSDVNNLRQSQESFGAKVAHDLREMRERIDRAPQLAQQHIERLALDLDGARSEIATLRANTTKMRDEIAANTAAMRQDLASISETLATLLGEKLTPLFEKVDERLAIGLTRIASQISDSETALGDSYLQGRSQLASLRGDIATNAGDVLLKFDEAAGKLDELPDRIAIIRAEMRADCRQLERAIAAMREETLRQGAVRALEFDVISIWLHRPRWWQWRYWFPRKPNRAPEPERGTTAPVPEAMPERPADDNIP